MNKQIKELANEIRKECEKFSNSKRGQSMMNPIDWANFELKWQKKLNKLQQPTVEIIEPLEELERKTEIWKSKNKEQWKKEVLKVIKKYNSKPNSYFVSLGLLDECATEIVKLFTIPVIIKSVCPNCGSHDVIYEPDFNPKPKCLDCDHVWAYEP